MSEEVSTHFTQNIPKHSFSSGLPDPLPPDHSTDFHLLEEDARPVRPLELQDKWSKLIPM